MDFEIRQRTDFMIRNSDRAIADEIIEQKNHRM